MKVKGKVKAIDCFEPICEIGKAGVQLQERVADYHKALDFYFPRDWDSAENIFKTLLQDGPDSVLYGLYQERIGALREQTLPEDWDGSFTHTSK